MGKIGHEAPIFDNQERGLPLRVDATDDQLRISESQTQDSLPAEPTRRDQSEPLPPHLTLTDKEQDRVDSLLDTQGRQLAMLKTTRSKAVAIIGHEAAVKAAKQADADKAERLRAEPESSVDIGEIAELIRSTYIDKTESPDTDKK